MPRTPYLEHANISVTNLDQAVAFFRTAFPRFKVRGTGGIASDGTTPTWIHVGDDDTYVCLSLTRMAVEGERKRYTGPQVNHIGFVVEDGEDLRRRLVAAGYKQGSVPPTEHPYRKRFYFHDPDGNEYEFVEYLSEDPRKRNDYEIETNPSRAVG